MFLVSRILTIKHLEKYIYACDYSMNKEYDFFLYIFLMMKSKHLNQSLNEVKTSELFDGTIVLKIRL